MPESRIGGNDRAMTSRRHRRPYSTYSRNHSAIQAEGLRSLNEGDKIEFDIVEGQKGRAAENVSPV